MKLGAQRLVDALTEALQTGGTGGDASVSIPGDAAHDLLIIMRSAAKQDARNPEIPTRLSRFEGYQVVAWLRNEAASYRTMAEPKDKSLGKALAFAYAGTCSNLADDLEKALEIGGGDPISPEMPRRWRYVDPDPTRSPGAGRKPGEPIYGTYYPRTDLCANDMGGRSTGKPSGVEWLDPEPDR